MLFLFSQGKKCNTNQKKKSAVYGEDVVSERVCQNVDLRNFMSVIRLVKIVSAQIGLWWLMMTKSKV